MDWSIAADIAVVIADVVALAFLAFGAALALDEVLARRKKPVRPGTAKSADSTPISARGIPGRSAIGHS
jgi:hypothetical protein